MKKLLFLLLSFITLSSYGQTPPLFSPGDGTYTLFVHPGTKLSMVQTGDIGDLQYFELFNTDEDQDTLNEIQTLSHIGNTYTLSKGGGSFDIPTILTRNFSSPSFISSTTATKLSTTRDAYTSYSYDGSVTITVLGGQGITAVLTYADNAAMTLNPVIVDSNGFSTSGLAGLSQTQTISVKGYIPADKYRQVTFILSKTGTATLPSAPTTIKTSQEVLQ